MTLEGALQALGRVCQLTQSRLGCRAAVWVPKLGAPGVQSRPVGPLADRVQRVHEGLPQLPCLPGLHQRQEPRRGRAGGGESPAAVPHGEGRALHEHPASRRP